MITIKDIGWHRLMALKQFINDEDKGRIDKQVFLNNGIKVNIEYVSSEVFMGQVIKGNKQFKDHDIIEFAIGDIDQNLGIVLEFKKD